MQKTSPEISELKKRIEKSLKRKMKTPTDFIFLSGAVFERTRETMSPTTLKRLWGYIEGADQTRNSTLERGRPERWRLCKGLLEARPSLYFPLSWRTKVCCRIG